jgi:sugar phosphate isomerase/epimerase
MFCAMASGDKEDHIIVAAAAPTRAAPRPGCALGTTFALRGGVSAAAVLDGVREAGADGLLLCEGLPAEVFLPLLGLLRRSGDISLVAVDGAIGAQVLGRPSLGRASLASLDREEGRAAAGRVKAALEVAQERGAPYVFTELGPVSGAMGRWERLRDGFLRGEFLEERGLCERAMAERDALSGPHLWACLRALDSVLTEAARRGVGVLLKNPRRGLELPTALELRVLREELAGAPLWPVLDLPAAHLTSAMRLWPLRETVLGFSAGPLAFLGDACGAVGGLVPGRGEVDVAAVARSLGPEVRRGFVPWEGLTMAEVRAGCEAIKGLSGKGSE